MKNLLVILALILSTNLFGQNRVISEPDRKGCNGLYYEKDSTILLYSDNKCIKISQKQLPELIKIFEKADKLSEYCQHNAEVNIKRDIDIIYNGKYGDIFTFEFDYSGSSILVKGIFISVYKCKFIEVLTTKRDNYYRELASYYQKQNTLQKELNEIVYEYKPIKPTEELKKEYSPSDYNPEYILTCGNKILFNKDSTISFINKKKQVLLYSQNEIKQLRKLIEFANKIYTTAVDSNITTKFTKSLGYINGLEYGLEYLDKNYCIVVVKIRNCNYVIYHSSSYLIQYGNDYINNLFQAYDSYYKELNQYNNYLNQVELKSRKNREIISKL